MHDKTQIKSSENILSENYKNLSANEEIEFLLLEKIREDMQWGGEV